MTTIRQRCYMVDMLQCFQLNSYIPRVTLFVSSKTSPFADDVLFPGITFYRNMVGDL